jgi:hypothetical protein
MPKRPRTITIKKTDSAEEDPAAEPIDAANPRAASRAWDATRRRWKRRKYDLRGEADVGHVVQQQQQRQQQQQQARVTRRTVKEASVTTTTLPPPPRHRNNEYDDDGLVLYKDDQAKVFDALRQSAVVPEVPSAAMVPSAPEPWDMGVAPPRACRRWRSTASLLSPPRRDSFTERRYTRRAWSTAPRRPFDHPGTAPFPLHRCCLRPQVGASGLASRTSLLPRRQMLRALARHLLGGAAETTISTHPAALVTLWKLCGTKEEAPPRLPLSTQAILLEEVSRRQGLAALSSHTKPLLRAPAPDVGYPLLRRSAPHVDPTPRRGVTPETTYVPLPGTVPPPPLSSSTRAFVYGPVDRCAQVLHASGRIDPVLSTLSLAALVPQMAAARNAERPHWQAQMTAVLQALLQYNQNHVYKRLAQKFRTPDLEVPLAFWYRTVLQYCAMVVAGLIPPKDAEDHGPLVPMVDHLWDFLEEHIAHNGLQLFSKLHMLQGLLRIAKMVPASGRAILGQPLDRGRTPIDIVRQLLEHLEQQRWLSATPTHEQRIQVGALEYAFFRAAGTWAQCLAREKTVVEFHGWYLGALASSLLLCSGRVIGTGRTSGATRRPLPKFQEMRRETARAWRELAHLAQQQPSQTAHQTMVSFLEWSQVLGLLLGHTHDTELFRSVRSLYQYHSMQWILQENTKAAHSTVFTSSTMYDGSELEILARSLEMNPSEIGRWRSFVAALGPLDMSEGSPRSSVPWWGVDRCNWWDTCLLQPILDRSSEGTQHSSKPSTPNVDDLSNEMDESYRKMVHHLRSADPFQRDSFISSSNEKSDPNPMLNPESQSLCWLDDLVLSLDNNADLMADVSRFEKNGEDLYSFRTVENKDRPVEIQSVPWNLQACLSGLDVPQYELMGYKVLIVCHLYSAAHASVTTSVQHLFRSAQAAWSKYQKDGRPAVPPDLDTYLAVHPEVTTSTMDNQPANVNGRNAWLTLRWLYRMGLDVTQIEL